MTIRCCYGCKERKVGEQSVSCHSTCERYLAEKAKHDKELEEKHKRNEKRDMLWDTYLNGVKNMKTARAKHNEQRRRK